MSENGMGWVSIHRGLQNHWLYEDKPFNYSMAWIDLIMACNHSDSKLLFNHNLIAINRGQMLTSVRKLGDRWGWGRDKVSRFLKMLEEDGMIVKESDSQRTLITLVKYDFFQGCASENRTANGHEQDTGKDTDPAQTIMSNNDSIMRNKDKGKPKTFIPPTPEEVGGYCAERNNGIDPNHFCDYYSARNWTLTNGKKAKDWKALVRTWESNNKKWKSDQTGKRGECDDPRQREEFKDEVFG